MKKQQYFTPQTCTVHVALQQVICVSLPSGSTSDEQQPDQDGDDHWVAE